MECKCGTVMLALVRQCPMCGRVLNPEAPRDEPSFPGRPHPGRARNLQRPSFHDKLSITETQPKRPTNRPAATKSTPPWGAQKAEHNDASLVKSHRSENRPAFRTDDHRPDERSQFFRARLAEAECRAVAAHTLPTGTVKLRIELRRARGSNVVSGFKQPAKVASHELVLVAKRNKGSPLILKVSDPFSLRSAAVPTVEADAALSSLKQFAQQYGLFPTERAENEHWYAYVYRVKAKHR